MEIIRLVLFIISTSLAFGSDWPQIPNDYSGLVQDQQGNQGGNCPDGNCPTMVRPKPNSFAQKAAKAAKEASDAQVPAAAAAARQVQKMLADKAANAAKAAEAAYVGKQQLVEQIQSELREGQQVVKKERSHLMATKDTANIARQGVNQAKDEVKSLTDVMKKANEGVAHSERVVTGSHHAVAEQKQAVAEAKGRLDLLLKQADQARNDYKNTKVAAEKAACAAQEARQRAGRERRMLEIASHTPTNQQTFQQNFYPNNVTIADINENTASFPLANKL